MRKYVFFLFLCISKVNCYAQFFEKDAVYGQCVDIFNCFQIKILADGRFQYYINEYFPGEALVDGSWKVVSDTLFLNINKPKQLKTTIVRHKTNENENILNFYLVSRDTIPICGADIKINSSDELVTDSIGSIHYPDQVERLDINYYGFLADTTFIVGQKEYQNMDFYIPLFMYPPITHQQPDKWLIEGNNLIPFWNTDGKLKLRRDRSIKKVSQRKKLPELR